MPSIDRGIYVRTDDAALQTSVAWADTGSDRPSLPLPTVLPRRRDVVVVVRRGCR